MPTRYQIIKNVAIYNDLTHSPTSWYQNTNLHFVPDEMIIRQITYHGPNTGDGAFLIWCSAINDYIGSFSVSEATGFTTVSITCAPNTHIALLPNSINQTLQFQIHSISGSGTPVTDSTLTGTIIINLDFVKY